MNISIIGNVQGVFFRRTVKHEAGRKGIAGFARNEPDSSVYIEAEGPEEALDDFILWLKAGADEGPRAIKDVDVADGQFQALEGFEIR